MRFTASKPLSCFSKLFRPNSLKSPIGKAQTEGRKNNKQTIRTALNRRSSSDSNAEGAEGGGGTFLLFMHLRKKIFIFRDIFDIPAISGSVSIHEVVTETIDNLNRMYPDLMPGYPTLKMKERNTHQGLICLYHVLECMADSWVEDKSMRDKFKKPHIETSPLDELVELVLVMLDCINKAAKQRFESMDAERKHKHSGSIRLKPYPKPSVDCNSEYSKSPASLSPRTPNSVLPDSPRFADLLGAMLGSYSPHQLLNLRVQAVEELSPVDLKRLVVHVMPHFAGKDNFHQNLKSASMEEEAKIEARDNDVGEKNGRKNEGEKHDHEAKETKNPTPTENEDEVVDMVQPPALPEKAVSTPSSAPPPPPPLMRASTNPSPLGSYIHPPPPPPSPSYSPPPSPSAATPPPPPLVPGAPPPPLSGKKIHPPPPGPTMKGAAPPPPGGMRTVFCPRSKTKLKRSSHMGNLYRILRGRVEGSCLPGGKSSPGNKNVINGNAGNGGSAGGGGTGMAEALAEMTKRSTYFQHIEEDMDKHGKAIKELQRDLYVFKTRDMDELLKFHNHVESLLEVLTDETQILSKFQGFPMNKLETLRMAAALSTKLNGIVLEIQNWKIEPPLAENLDKVEKYFSKIKAELEGIERTKDENSKLFESQNIHFDLSILTKIKEYMVDLSSGFIELALEERREEKASSKPDGKHASSVKMLWRAFQFAFKVYSFAGGQDERADSLTTELAKEIETHPIQE